MNELYRMLVHELVATEFPKQSIAVPTRMIDATPRGVWRGDAIATSTPAVVVAVARAGLLPSQSTFDFLNQVLQPEGVRQDHLALAGGAERSSRPLARHRELRRERGAQAHAPRPSTVTPAKPDRLGS